MPQGYTAIGETLCKATSTLFPQSRAMLRTMPETQIERSGRPNR